jgi:hypothetical protein
MKRPLDPLIQAFEKLARNDLRRALTRLVRRFGYSDVRSELLEAKRLVGDARAKAAAAPKARQPTASARIRNDDLLHLWLVVENIRREATPKMTARGACRKLAKEGGIVKFVSGTPVLGLNPSIHSKHRNKITIEREYKRAEQLRKADSNINADWQNLIADRMRRPRPFQETFETLPWRSFGGKTVEK